jgi:glycosyltransferase involved in cell wall biosynthesis
MPLVSFCVSTYKRGNTLTETLRSIQRQTFVDFEVIISDNDAESSGKPFVEILNDSRFIYSPNGKNLGMKASFNKSLSLSSGKYIVMIADDDPVYSDMLETLVKLSEDYPSYGMYMGGCDWLAIDKEAAKINNIKIGTNSCLSDEYDYNTIRTFTTEEFLMNFYTFKIFKHFLWSTCMVKRELLIKNGGIPDYGSPFLGDYAYMSIAATENGCVIINKSLGCQTLHRENFGRNQNEQLPIVAVNFPKYLEEKLSYLENWPLIKNLINRFTSLWLVEHISFLYLYKGEGAINLESLDVAQKQVFAIDYIKPFKLKFILKKNFRSFHDLIVVIKSKLTNA